MAIVLAKEVRAKIQEIGQKLDEIQDEAVKLENAPVPGYIQDFGHFMNVKMGHLRYTVERVQKKIPDRFKGEEAKNTPSLFQD